LWYKYLFISKLLFKFVVQKQNNMLHSEKITVLADNGVQYFMNCDIERILHMAYDYDYSNGSRTNRYTDNEVCEHFGISIEELNRMKHTLSFDYCHDSSGNYKF